MLWDEECNLHVFKIECQALPEVSRFDPVLPMAAPKTSSRSIIIVFSLASLCCFAFGITSQVFIVLLSNAIKIIAYEVLDFIQGHSILHVIHGIVNASTLVPCMAIVPQSIVNMDFNFDSTYTLAWCPPPPTPSTLHLDNWHWGTA